MMHGQKNVKLYFSVRRIKCLCARPGDGLCVKQVVKYIYIYICICLNVTFIGSL